MENNEIMTYEMNEAVVTTQDNEADFIHKLSKPIVFDGKEIKELAMFFDELTANDLMRAEKEAKMRLGKKAQMAVPELNKTYCACVAAKAAGVKAELIFSLRAKDFTQICLKVQDFLLDGDLENEDYEI